MNFTPITDYIDAITTSPTEWLNLLTNPMTWQGLGNFVGFLLGY